MGGSGSSQGVQTIHKLYPCKCFPRYSLRGKLVLMFLTHIAFQTHPTPASMHMKACSAALCPDDFFHSNCFKRLISLFLLAWVKSCISMLLLLLISCSTQQLCKLSNLLQNRVKRSRTHVRPSLTL